MEYKTDAKELKRTSASFLLGGRNIFEVKIKWLNYMGKNRIRPF